MSSHPQALGTSMLFVASLLMLPWSAVGDYQVQFVANLSFTTFDNFTLHGDAYVPVPQAANETFPVLIFPNSWGLPQFEYLLKALQFGERGYIALEYETRGWYLSGGEIDVCGPKDLRDGSTIIDYVLQPHISDAWRVNPAKIAFVGISYGAGIALSMAGTDVRVQTAVVMSGWNNLTDAVYNYDTPNLAWGMLLELAADSLGHPSPTLEALFNDLLLHHNISTALAWAEERSPGRHLDSLNARQVPLFLSSNFIDRLFRPQHMLHFFEQLAGPKFLLLNQGMHAEPEGLGLVDVPGNYIWGKAKRWLDYWLKGIDTGIIGEPKVHMERGSSIFDKTYVTFPTWPDPLAVSPATWYLTPRAGSQFGGLSEAPANSSATPAPDSIGFSLLPSIGEGIPFLSDALASIGSGPTVDLTLTNTQTSLVFISPPLQADTTICGIVRVNLTLLVPAYSNWQVNGFLYDVDALGIGTLISDMAFTHWAAASNSSGGATVQQQLTDIMFHTFCRKFPQGARIGLGFALYNNLWEPANDSPDLSIGFVYPEGASGFYPPSLTLPVNPS